MKLSELELPRKYVLEFAEDMERELDNNDHKSGWGQMSYGELCARAGQELAELRRAVKRLDTEYHIDALVNLISEAADVGNFAMMIADNARAEIAELSRTGKREAQP